MSAHSTPFVNPEGPWWTRAACRDEDPELFFPEIGQWTKAIRAKTICATCPVQRRCLEEALTGPQAILDQFGIFGGTSPNDRKQLRDKRLPGGQAKDPQFYTDPAKASAALHRANQVGIGQAAREYGVHHSTLLYVWDHWGLGRPASSKLLVPSPLHENRAAAEAAVELARRIGLPAALEQLGVGRTTYYRALRRWDLEGAGRTDCSPRAPTPALDETFLALNPDFARPVRATRTALFTRARRREEAELLGRRVSVDLYEENIPKAATRTWIIVRRTQRAVNLAGQRMLVVPLERQQLVRRLLTAKARRYGGPAIAS